MDPGPKPRGGGKKQHGKRGTTKPLLKNVTEVRLTITPPPGSHFKGWRRFTVQELGAFELKSTLYLRQWWKTRDGYITAPLPKGSRGHFSPNLRRFTLFLHYECQVTVARIHKVRIPTKTTTNSDRSRARSSG
ncbi:MAG: hypothetical protein FWD68_21420 [Alphaproteobacteria bacterium]|nr:hypothetical protein [Alphaproteobacteria bacterium]